MKYFTVLGIIILLLSKCDHKNTIEGIPVSDYYNNCEEQTVDFGEIITLGDPNDKFMISLPYSWDISETYNDSVYGIFAANIYNTANNRENLLSISVSGYQTNDSLNLYFRNELLSLKKDKKIKVLEAGEIIFNEQNSFWVLFESDESQMSFMNLVLFLKPENKREVYLIQTLSYKTDNYKDRLCHLKQLVNTFEFVYE